MEKVRKVRKDLRRARSLVSLASERLEDVEGYKPYKKVEEYWDIAKELILALMYASGFHTLSHKAMVGWLARRHPEFSRSELATLDTFRKARNDVSYYGRKQKGGLIREHEGKMREVLHKLRDKAEGVAGR